MGRGGGRGEGIRGIWCDPKGGGGLLVQQMGLLTCGTPESWLRVAKETRGSHDNVPPEAQLSRSEPQPRSWLNCLPMNPWATSEYFMFSSIRFGECAECLLSRARPGGCELEPDSARPLTAQPGCERRFGV